MKEKETSLRFKLHVISKGIIIIVLQTDKQRNKNELNFNRELSTTSTII